MTRSRVILLVAWGLLAIGVFVQMVRPDPGAEQATDQVADEESTLAYRDTEADADSDTAPDEGLDERPRDSARSSGAAASSPTGIDSDGVDSTGGVPSLGTAPATDPAGWREVPVTLAPEAYIATVKSSSATGHGVASLLQPGPGAVQHWFPSPTQFGGDRVFLVVDQTSSEEYVKVSLPVMPNGQEGWIPRSEVEISKIEHRALIDLSVHSVTVWDGEGMVMSTKAVTGRPQTPTPFGTFYVRDIVTQAEPTGDYGPYVLALSGFSEAMETFQGGLPALAIHGTDRPDQIGTEASAGCIRIPNDLITILAESVPLGTPVTIVA